MPALPILCFGRLWAGYRADSADCEVSLNCTLYTCFAAILGPGFSVLLLLLLLDGLVYVVALWLVVFAWRFSVA